jgi:hypothetical protein
MYRDPLSRMRWWDDRAEKEMVSMDKKNGAARMRSGNMAARCASRGEGRTRRILAAGLIVLFIAHAHMAWAQPAPANGPGKPIDAFHQKLAAQKTLYFEGDVLSHDVACRCLVIRTAKGTLTLQEDYAKFDPGYDRARGLDIGRKASGTYKTVDYINYAIEIHQSRTGN